MLYIVFFLLINIVQSHDRDPDFDLEKNFYDRTLPEIYADLTPEEKKEVKTKLKEIRQLQEQIDTLQKIKQDNQNTDLLSILLTQNTQKKENQQ